MIVVIKLILLELGLYVEIQINIFHIVKISCDCYYQWENAVTCVFVDFVYCFFGLGCHSLECFVAWSKNHKKNWKIIWNKISAISQYDSLLSISWKYISLHEVFQYIWNPNSRNIVVDYFISYFNHIWSFLLIQT